MCKFVAEPGTFEILIFGGDARDSRKSAPAQRFTRRFLEAIWSEVFRYACTSQLIVNDDLYSQSMYLVLMVEREAKFDREHTGYWCIRLCLLDAGYKEIAVTLRRKIGILTETSLRV